MASPAKKKSATKKSQTAKKSASAEGLTAHQRRVRARVSRMVELAGAVARRASKGDAVSPSQLQKAFVGFALRRRVDVEALTPLTAIALMHAFYTDVSFQGRAHGIGDMLLYQHGTRGEEATIGLVRQLYHRGRGQQLCVDLVYPASKLRLSEAVSLWSQKLPSSEAWVEAAKALLGGALECEARPTVKVYLASF